MTAVLDQVKDVAYTAVGVNLLVTDAIVGHEVRTPEFVGEHSALARKQATVALTGFRARTEPQAVKLEGRLPEQVADVMSTNRTKAWKFIGIDAPKAEKAAAKTTTAKKTKSSTAKSSTAKSSTAKTSTKKS